VRRFPKDWWFPIASSHGTGYRSVEADKFVRSEDVGLDVLMVADAVLTVDAHQVQLALEAHQRVV
jgi:hypothetical protein